MTDRAENPAVGVGVVHQALTAPSTHHKGVSTFVLPFGGRLWGGRWTDASHTQKDIQYVDQIRLAFFSSLGLLVCPIATSPRVVVQSTRIPKVKAVRLRLVVVCIFRLCASYADGHDARSRSSFRLCGPGVQHARERAPPAALLTFDLEQTLGRSTCGWHGRMAFVTSAGTSVPCGQRTARLHLGLRTSCSVIRRSSALGIAALPSAKTAGTDTLDWTKTRTCARVSFPLRVVGFRRRVRS